MFKLGGIINEPGPVLKAAFGSALWGTLALYFAYVWSIGIVDTTGHGATWKTLLADFAPAVPPAIFLALLILAERGYFQVGHLLARESVSSKALLFVVFISILFGFVFFMLVDVLAATLTMMVLVTVLGLVVSWGLLLAGRDSYGLALFVGCTGLLHFLDKQVWERSVGVAGFSLVTVTKPTVLALLLTFAVWLWAHMRSRAPFRHSMVAAAVLVYLLVGLNSAVFSPDVGRSLQVLFWDSLPILLCLVAVTTFRSTADVKKLLYAMAVSLVTLSFFNVFFFLRDTLSMDLSVLVESRGGPGQLVTQINFFALVLASSIPFAAGLLVAEEHRVRRICLGVSICFFSVSLLLTLSRDHWLALALGLTVFACFATGERRRRQRIIVLAVVIALVGVALSRDLLGLAKFVGGSPVDDFLQSSVVTNRLDALKAAIQMLDDFPLTGVGVGMYSTVYPSYGPRPLFYTTNEMPHAHNLYLHTAAERGFPGLIALLLFFGLVLKAGISTLRRTRGEAEQAIIAGLLASLITFMAGAVTEGGYLGIESFEFLGFMVYLLIAGIICMNRSMPAANSHRKLKRPFQRMSGFSLDEDP